MALKSLEQRVADLVEAARSLGLPVTDSQVLSDRGNLIVRLLPCDCVARVLTLFGDEDPSYWRAVAEREGAVAQHLAGQGVPVVSPVTTIAPGPHSVGTT